MKLTKLFVFCAVLLVGLAAWSQDFPRAEVAADYSYARFYPVAHGTQSLSLNGGGGALVVNVNQLLWNQDGSARLWQQQHHLDESGWRGS